MCDIGQEHTHTHTHTFKFKVCIQNVAHNFVTFVCYRRDIMLTHSDSNPIMQKVVFDETNTHTHT